MNQSSSHLTVQPLYFGSIDLPHSWADRTTYLFVEPLHHTAQMLSSSARTEQAAGYSLSITEADRGQQLLVELITLQIEQLRASCSGFRLLSRDAIPHPEYGDLPGFKVSFEPAPKAPVFQKHAFVTATNSTLFVQLTFTTRLELSSHLDEVTLLRTAGFKWKSW